MWRGRSGKGVLRIGFGAGGGEAVRKEMPVHGAELESFWQLQNLFSMPVRYLATSELGVNHAKTTSSWSKRTFFPHESQISLAYFTKTIIFQSQIVFTVAD